MGQNTTQDEAASSGPWCPTCETDEHILVVAGTSIEQLNVTNQSHTIYECQNCGTKGEVHSDCEAGKELRKGALFGGEDQ